MSSNMRSAAYSSLSQGSSRGSHPSSLFPAIIAQLLNATQAYPDAPFAIEGGAEVGQVMLIAQIISMKYHATNNVFCLDDASGRIEARHWIDSPDLVARESYEGVVEGNWARIIGRVRIFNLKLFVNVAHIRAIKDPHEIFYHLTEVMVALTKLTRNTIRASHKQYRDARPRVLHADQTSLPPAQRTVSERYVHLPPLLHSIIMFLHSQPKHDDGYHIAAICEAVGTDVSDALQELRLDGLIFNTAKRGHVNGHWCEVDKTHIEQAYNVWRAATAEARDSSITSCWPAAPISADVSPTTVVLNKARASLKVIPIATRPAAVPQSPTSPSSSDDESGSESESESASDESESNVDNDSESDAGSRSTESSASSSPTPRPLEVFFARYPAYPYNPLASPTAEFARMSHFFGWPRKAKAYAEFKKALAQQFNAIYGTDVNDIRCWHLLCSVLQIDPPPAGLKECREVVSATHVNLVDLVQSAGQIQTKKFSSEVELANYSKRHRKFFPLEAAYAGGVLRFLLRHIRHPRSVELVDNQEVSEAEEEAFDSDDADAMQ